MRTALDADVTAAGAHGRRAGITHPPEAGTTLSGTALVRQGVAGQATTPEGPSLQVTAAEIKKCYWSEKDYWLRRTRLDHHITTRCSKSTAAGGPNAVAKSARYVSTGLTNGASHCSCCHPIQGPYTH